MPLPLRRLVLLCFAAAALTAAAAPLAAQVMRLPPVEWDESRASELLPPPDMAGVNIEPELPFDARPGMFQKLLLDGTWLAPGGRRGLGTSDLDLRAVLAVPCPTPRSPLLITPGFAAHWFDGPAGVDLPPRVYDAYCQFRWMSQLTPRLGVDLAVAPGVYSDFDQASDEALRITGHGAAAWTCTPALKLVLGAAYFDRLETSLLPIGGLIWTPNDDTSFELIFPQPRIARRVYWWADPIHEVRDWVYLAGEFGGGAWAARRDSGENDRFDYRDVRLLLGIERKVLGAPDFRFEVGYVFARKIRWASPTPGFDPTDTVLLRAGIAY